MSCKDYEDLGYDMSELCGSLKWTKNQFCEKTCKRYKTTPYLDCKDGKIYGDIFCFWIILLSVRISR